ncbi:MAG: PIN domain-containing protein [Nitrospiraceae bacterium]|nr:PIN domain-containing protein [Nitrospiraceae bacterium]
MKKKIYVLDTSALLAYPDLMFRLKGNCEIVIPKTVIKELLGLKHSKHLMIAGAAEKVLNTLHLFGEYLPAGVGLFNEAILRTYEAYVPIDDLASMADNRIVGAAISLKKGAGGEVIVLSTDTNMRNVARAYGLTAKLPCFEDVPQMEKVLS